VMFLVMVTLAVVLRHGNPLQHGRADTISPRSRHVERVG
jgi:hypothetical protein